MARVPLTPSINGSFPSITGGFPNLTPWKTSVPPEPDRKSRTPTTTSPRDLDKAVTAHLISLAKAVEQYHTLPWKDATSVRGRGLESGTGYHPREEHDPGGGEWTQTTGPQGAGLLTSE